MKKNNTKGFMLLETLIVSTVILSMLIFLYVQFTNIKNNYDISFRYNTIPGLYMTKEIANFLNENGYTTLSNQLDSGSDGYINITSSANVSGNSSLYTSLIDETDIRTIIFVNDDLSTLKNYLSSNSYNNGVFSEELKRYITRLSTNATNHYRIITEFNNNTFASVMLGGE